MSWPNRRIRTGSVIFSKALLKSPIWPLCKKALKRQDYVEYARKSYGKGSVEIFFKSYRFPHAKCFQNFMQFTFTTYGDEVLLRVEDQPIYMT